jgi:nucleotide-binding universal stress UspA family protein
MYQRIFVPLDGSHLAEQVLPYVEALAEKFNSNVTLLRVTTSPEMLIVPTGINPIATEVPVTPYVEDMGTFAHTLEVEREETAKYLDAVAERFRSRGIEVVCDYLEGPPAQIILEHASALNAELIAMSTHGRGGLARLVLGSTADEVLRKATCPVLMVRVREDAESQKT